jgi:crotonobetainyl-CoA:carnitine CoA-transferase CaiB-like acyl-CoA transferase
VVDLTRNLAGPYCTMILGDMGAEVIKVESPSGGDELRHLYTFKGRDKETEDYFGMWNRNKRSLALDLKTPFGKRAMTELLKVSDVFVENLAPGAATRLGFGWEEMHALNPRLIYVSISGFGPDDPRRAYDGIVQAASGAMDQTGYPDGPPTYSGIAIGDLCAAFFATVTTLSTLYEVRRSGQGTRIDVAMMDCLIALLAGGAAEFLATGSYWGRLGAQTPHRVPHNIFKTADDRWVFIVSNNDIWPRLCNALDLNEYASDSRFNLNQDRVANRAKVNEILGDRIRQLALGDVCDRLTANQVPNSPVSTVAEVLSSEYVKRHQMVLDVAGELRDGRQPIKVMGTPYRMSRGQPKIRFGPPRLGEANQYVLHDLLGLAQSEGDAQLLRSM